MNEADIPIDIHSLKLQDWLISRRICSKNIQTEVKQIGVKVRNLLSDNSNDLLQIIQNRGGINYYDCLEILGVLKETEKDTRNMFGTYGSQRMKDWQEVLRLYEKNNVYLGEAAQLYVRNINYEIPGIKKQMIKLEQQAEDCAKRIQNLEKPEALLQEERATLLQKLNIKGENLREELLEVAQKLPELYEQSIRSIGTIEKAVDLYSECRGQNICLPVLKYLIKFGNTTVYQYIYKKPPLSIEEPKSHLLNNSADTIDFDLDLNVEIDFGSSELEITADDGTGDTVAKGENSFTLLDSPLYRDRFLDELYELESFLRMRFSEINQSCTANNVMFSLLEISTHDGDSILKMLNNVEAIIKAVCNEQTHHLFQLKHSQKYANLLELKLQQFAKAAEKIRTTKSQLQERIIQLKEHRQALNPALTELVAYTKKLQLNIERDISKRYKNRDVNLLGGIN